MPTGPNLLEVSRQRWRRGQCLQVDGVCFADGRVVLFDAQTSTPDGRPRCLSHPIADTTIASLLKDDPDPWVELTSLAELRWEANLEVRCGEGAMGNEGYVSLRDLTTGDFVWVLFSTCSNPFTALRREGDNIVAEAGYEQVWHIPLDAPERFLIHDVG